MPSKKRTPKKKFEPNSQTPPDTLPLFDTAGVKITGIIVGENTGSLFLKDAATVNFSLTPVEGGTKGFQVKVRLDPIMLGEAGYELYKSGLRGRVNSSEPWLLAAYQVYRQELSKGAFRLNPHAQGPQVTLASSTTEAPEAEVTIVPPTETPRAEA